MNFKDFINSMSDDQLIDYAKRCRTTPQYIKCHLLNAYKQPRDRLRMALATESNGSITYHDVLVHFYKQPEIAHAS